MLSNIPVECPRALLSKAQQRSAVTAVVANAASELVVKSAFESTQLGLINPVFVGDEKVIRREAAKLSWDITDVRIEHSEDEVSAAERAVAIARGGEARAIVKGDVHTDTLLRAVLDRASGLRTGRLLSHVFHMTLPGSDQALCISDAVLNVLPSVDQKRLILANAVELLHALGNENPKVALLSATESPSQAMPSSVEAAQICQRIKEDGWTGAQVEGPLAFDLAVSQASAQIKGVENPVAGRADLLLVPNIETGNALFKMMVYFMSAAAAGVVLGAGVPVMLTSRADPLAARIASAALTAIYARSIEQGNK